MQASIKIFPANTEVSVLEKFEELLGSGESPAQCVENSIEFLITNNIIAPDLVPLIKNQIEQNYALLKAQARMKTLKYTITV